MLQAHPTLAMVAGEASGDLLASLLLQGLQTRWPTLHAAGIGGAHMRSQGFDAWWPSEKLAVRGYVEVLRHYREISGIRKQLYSRLLQDKPQLFIGVDAPDFNLHLEAKLKAQGVKTVHFICPSIWAWRAQRVHQIKKSVDHVLCIFPFEPQLLAQHGIASTYVGHPLASVIPMEPDKEAARSQLGLRADQPVVAILPGSRASEIHYLAERFFKAASLIKKDNAAIQLIVPAIPQLKNQIEQAAQSVGAAQDVHIVQGQSHTVLAACDVALVASGTATLEAALFKRPMVIAYNMNALSWQLMRRKQLQPWVGLPNILCGDALVPELLQTQATPQALAQATLAWLHAEPARIRALQTRFTQLHHSLQRDTFSLASDAIGKILEL